MGRKNISNDFITKLFSTFTFSKEEQTALQEAAKKSGTTIKINLTNSNKNQRELALQFARSLDSLTAEDISEISKFFNTRHKN
jgi:SOS response regulatory protein OraA/RecX